MTKMTKMTKEKTSRNTGNSTRKCTLLRARNWCFTLNNYTREEINTLASENTAYVFQEEKGEDTGTPHLQGLIKFKLKKSLKQMKALNKRAHWSISKNIIASENYCCKVETRNGMVYTNIKRIKKMIDANDQMTTQNLKNKIQFEMYEHLKERREKYGFKTSEQDFENWKKICDDKKVRNDNCLLWFGKTLAEMESEQGHWLFRSSKSPGHFSPPPLWVRGGAPKRPRDFSG